MFEHYLKCGGLKKFIVIKIEDLVKYVPSYFKLAMLDNDLTDIAAGREKDGKAPYNEYIVVNADESYINEIIDVLKKHGHWGENNQPEKAPRPEIVCLCGSTRFKEEFIKVQEKLTLEGKIVLSVGLFGHVDHPEIYTDGKKAMLDELHKRKIDLADRVLVLNVGGYIGDSTRSEIEYAEAHGKPVIYWESKEY